MEKARNLGAIFDSNLNLEAHVNNICCASYFHIRNIGQIRSYLSQADIETLVHALISSHLDQLNSAVWASRYMLLKKLQRVQNTAARLVMGAKRHDHITPVLARLHWLPVKQRISFKILLLTHKCIHGAAPAYLTELIQLYEPRQSLRSQGQLLLRPVIASMSYGDRSFSIAAPLLWNSLPLDIRSSKSVISVKKAIKSPLYLQAFHWIHNYTHSVFMWIPATMHCDGRIYVGARACRSSGVLGGW